jgi:hypothetical protein
MHTASGIRCDRPYAGETGKRKREKWEIEEGRGEMDACGKGVATHSESIWHTFDK